MTNLALTKNQKNIFYITLGGIAIYFIYKFIKGDKRDELEPELATQTEAIKQPNQTNFVPSKANYNLRMAKGDSGLEVGILQKSLKGIDVDGRFGEDTETRLIQVTGGKTTTLTEFNEFLSQKKKSIDNIVSSGKNSNADFLKTLETQYLNSWNKAIQEGKDLFEYNGKLYMSQGGKLLATNK